MPNSAYTNALTGETWLDVGGDNHITYSFEDDYGRAWTEYEKNAFRSVLDTYAAVANLTFEEVPEGAGEIKEHLLTNAELDAIFGTSPENYNGYHLGPGDGGDGYFCHDETYWNALDPGGHGYWMLLHEVGHALGLEHPHSTWHGSGLFPGVTLNDYGDKGDNDLNHGWHTVMSYIQSQPATPGGYTTGGPGAPMAFDIYTLQSVYGANTTTGAGDTTYYLNEGSAWWESIWDVGGSDTIAAANENSVVIDLRSATIENEVGGGGFYSYGSVDGAYTIAYGVTIENAVGGAGNDTIHAGYAINNLTGGGGADKFTFHNQWHTDGDRILDFTAGVDTLNMAPMDAKTGNNPNDKFIWIGTQNFHDVKGELRKHLEADGWHLEGDRNGDGNADFDVFIGSGFSVNDVLL